MKRVMIVDALNMYFRAYIVDPSLSTNGQPIGGLKGFLKILQKLSRDLKPDMVVVCWDGPGGSRKRREIIKEYKQGRKPIRLNRETNLTEDEELQNKIWQQAQLLEYLNHLPVVQYMFPEVEADDVIAFVAQSSHFAGWEKIIVSSDKDFLQLCNGETVLFRPIQKKVHNRNNVLEEYGIHPNNFAVARAIAGDKSDNLRGVPGAGLPTIKKRLPFLQENKEFSLKEIVEYCRDFRRDDKRRPKFYEAVTLNENIIRLNYRLMQLYNPTLSLQTQTKIDTGLREFAYDYNRTGFIKMMAEDGFGAMDWGDLYAIMNRISVDKPLHSK
jgi:5'-3' exonuclease